MLLLLSLYNRYSKCWVRITKYASIAILRVTRKLELTKIAKNNLKIAMVIAPEYNQCQKSIVSSKHNFTPPSKRL